MKDIIVRRNGEEIESKVIEITPAEIKYKKLDNLDGPLFTINKSDVFMIMYANGTKDIFNQPDKTINAENENTDMYVQGKIDAVEYYKGYVSAGTGCFFAGLLVGYLLGWIPALICSQTPPADENLNYPDPELIDNHAYKKGYVEEAFRIKRNKVWVNYAIGGGVWAAIYILIKIAK